MKKVIDHPGPIWKDTHKLGIIKKLKYTSIWKDTPNLGFIMSILHLSIHYLRRKYPRNYILHQGSKSLSAPSLQHIHIKPPIGKGHFWADKTALPKMSYHNEKSIPCPQGLKSLTDWRIPPRHLQHIYAIKIQ